MGLSKKMPWVASAAALSCLGAFGVQAVATTGDPSSAPGRVVTEAADSLSTYTDAELLEFLVAGQGPVADAHPELLTYLGFAEDKPVTPPGPMKRFTRDYLAADPDFHRTVAVPLQSGDPERVNEGLRQFTRELRSVVEAKIAQSPQKAAATNAQAAGWTWRGANIAVYANAVAVANAGVYANVGVATFVGAVLAVWYLEDGSMTGSEIEVETFVAELTDALAG